MSCISVKRRGAAVLHSFLCFEVLNTVAEQVVFPLIDSLWDYFLAVLKLPYQPAVEYEQADSNALFKIWEKLHQKKSMIFT
ncbi:hypothetical protein T10_318 [Trichinella papuae]|uniref:Uncharacterized protein n=1 Tax=Trichinella papuae TaxID=268474 RepID=A0A0V1MUJ0_9BILA|nr:hypothetical protein T10_318 [Trichinella papuae]